MDRDTLACIDDPHDAITLEWMTAMGIVHRHAGYQTINGNTVAVLGAIDGFLEYPLNRRGLTGLALLLL